MKKPAEIFPPGEFIADEMQDRGWTVAGLSAHSGLSELRLNQILGGDRLRLHECEHIASAFGQSAVTWANLNLAWSKFQKNRA